MLRLSVLACFVGIVTMQSAFAGSADCELIHDSVQRSYCRAATNRNLADCSAIKDAQTYRACVGYASGRGQDCEAIQDRTARQTCRAFAR